MTTFAQEKISLETWFDTNWSSTPVQYPNVTLSTNSLDEYITMEIVHDLSSQALTGVDQNLYRYTGFIVNRTFTRPAVGHRPVAQLHTDISDIWRAASIPFITIMSPIIELVGVNDGWYQSDIIHPFLRDAYKSVA